MVWWVLPSLYFLQLKPVKYQQRFSWARFLLMMKQPLLSSLFVFFPIYPQSHSPLRASRAFASSSCFLPLTLQLGTHGFILSFSIFLLYTLSLCDYPLLGLDGSRRSWRLQCVSSSVELQSSTVPIWTSLLGYSTGTSSSTSPQISLLSTATLFPPSLLTLPSLPQKYSFS